MSTQAEMFAAPKAPFKSRMARVSLAEVALFSYPTPEPGWLAAHIKENGILEPVVLADHGDAGYSIIEGRKRVAIARRLGHTHVQANVLDSDDVGPYKEALAVSLNELRAANPVTNYESVIHMFKERRIPESQIAKQTGLTLPAVKSILGLTALHPQILDAVRAARMKFSVARLLSKTIRQSQEKLLPVLAEKGTITARDVRELCPEYAAGSQTVTKAAWLAGAREALETLVATAPRRLDPALTKSVESLLNKITKEMK